MRLTGTSLRAKGWKAIFTKSNGRRYSYQRQDSRRQAIHSWGHLSGCNRRSNVRFVLASQKQRPGSSCPNLNSGCYMPEKTALLPCLRVQQYPSLLALECWCIAQFWKGKVLISVCLKYRSSHLNGNVFGDYRSRMLNVCNCPRSVREMMKTVHLSQPAPPGVPYKVAAR
jgi:hypothetical protein